MPSKPDPQKLLEHNTYWICLLSYSQELAERQMANDTTEATGVKKYLKECKVPTVDWNYYTDVIMKCKKTASW
jgi:hypothetical protein